MRLYEEWLKTLDAPTGAHFAVTFQGGGYFQGVKGVGEISAQTVVIYFTHGEAEIQGENLTVAKYADGDLELRGKIVNVLTRSAAELTDKA